MALSVSEELSVRSPPPPPPLAPPCPLPTPQPTPRPSPPPTPHPSSFTPYPPTHPRQVTAYESFLNLSPANLRLFLQSGTEAQYAQCRARQPMMDDIRLDVAESVGDLLCDIEEGYLRDGPLQSALPAALAVLRGDETIATNVDAFTARNLEQGSTQPPPAKQPKLWPKPEPRSTRPAPAAADAAEALSATSSVTPPSPSSSCTTAATADAAASPRSEGETLQ
jgi:hypothetical protein